MKQTILDVLKDKSFSVLSSEYAKESMATEIVEKLKNKGTYNEYRNDELEKREAKKSWVCQTCGKSTYETDYDYLVHPKIHLGCALEEEAKGKGIKEQYHEASSRMFKESKNQQLELALDVRTKDAESVEEPEDTSHSPEEIEAWNRQVEDCGTQQHYDKYRRKLSEEIVDDKSKKYIYESPDGGKTIYRRKFQKSEREVVKDFQKEMNERKTMIKNHDNNKWSDRSIEHMKSKYKDFVVKEKQVDEQMEENLDWYKNWKRKNFKK